MQKKYKARARVKSISFILIFNLWAAVSNYTSAARQQQQYVKNKIKAYTNPRPAIVGRVQHCRAAVDWTLHFSWQRDWIYCCCCCLWCCNQYILFNRIFYIPPSKTLSSSSKSNNKKIITYRSSRSRWWWRRDDDGRWWRWWIDWSVKLLFVI